MILVAPARLFNRLMIWLDILKKVRGIALKTQLGLFLSAFIDTFFYVVGSPLAALPRVYISGIIHSKSYNAYFHVRAFSDDLYSVMPGREEDVNDLVLSCLKEGDVFIDVGANIGYYSVMAGKIVGESGQVISIEPIPSTARVLSFNVKLNQLNNVMIIQKAAWGSNELISMYVPKGFYGMSSVYESKGTKDLLVVEGAPLDNLVSVSKAYLLKIDAEGSEYPILVGARKTLERTQYVVLEASTEKEEIMRLLKEKGFKIQKLKFTTYIFAYKNNVHGSSFQHNGFKRQKYSDNSFDNT
jgi:FkbM family methyltransferase